MDAYRQVPISNLSAFFSEEGLTVDYYLQRARDLTWQSINPGGSMNALCTVNLSSVLVGSETINIYFNI